MNKCQRGAFNKGVAAAQAGKPRDACPYPDIRQFYKNGNTWSRLFRRAWFNGWESEHAEEAK